jgi:hypothetical protein
MSWNVSSANRRRTATAWLDGHGRRRRNSVSRLGRRTNRSDFRPAAAPNTRQIAESTRCTAITPLEAYPSSASDRWNSRASGCVVTVRPALSQVRFLMLHQCAHRRRGRWAVVRLICASGATFRMIVAAIGSPVVCLHSGRAETCWPRAVVARHCASSLCAIAPRRRRSDLFVDAPGTLFTPLGHWSPP